MTWSQQLFRYCERGADPAFWAEPVNALSNLGFILAALAAGLSWHRRDDAGRSAVPAALCAAVALIGVGSFLFHTLATRWAQLGDVIPIGIFMLAYMTFVLRTLAGLSRMMSGAGLVVFALSLGLAGQITCGGDQPCANGSLGYLPALLAMLLMAAALLKRDRRAAMTLFAAGAIFAVSLTLRTLDMGLCGLTRIGGAAIGTHFLWHGLNALMLYLLLRLAVDRA